MSGLVPFLPPPLLDAGAICVGATCGAITRYKIGQKASAYIASSPSTRNGLTGWHTAGINVLGSFALGAVTATPVKAATTPAPSFGMTPRTKLLLGIGFCGAFTTFSTYAVDIVSMVERGEVAKAVCYGVGTSVGSIGAATVGMMAVRRFFGVGK
mmetsp:Transcript_20104/g.24858  ORF Transcript_20104/g.24858 Transcript_20104/m.24858 type:complete len:155 (+) Transcript_20104:72-536(+)|eukprot:CAMPEP_0172497126 /NCGR_PEP_ID=MMETSP1066-20121228/95676_1 /TAXON_ID=671091 /ORGANISM="Coscinodiscus wailesii, Strain CCMP2513" /LENGTH=154 /DNA_ID=CAMNT_0013269731 /DNA_START=67 /DNA_END=531 /DNA_ORIENTATION=-